MASSKLGWNHHVNLQESQPTPMPMVQATSDESFMSGEQQVTHLGLPIVSRLPDSSDLEGTVQQSSVASNLTEKIRECLRQRST